MTDKQAAYGTKPDRPGHSQPSTPSFGKVKTIAGHGPNRGASPNGTKGQPGR